MLEAARQAALLRSEPSGTSDHRQCNSWFSPDPQDQVYKIFSTACQKWSGGLQYALRTGDAK